MSKEKVYCGIEQEFQGRYPKQWYTPGSTDKEIRWFRNGGRAYKEHCWGVIETNTPLIPLTLNGDPSVTAYEHVLADRARVLEATKKDEIRGLSMHFNFSNDCNKLNLRNYLDTFGPTFTYLFARTTGKVGFATPIDRVEICSEMLRTPASIRGGLALGIAIAKASNQNELDLSQFKYSLADNELFDTRDNFRYSINFYDRLLEEGMDLKIGTISGRKSLRKIFNETINFLQPSIIKHCSEEAYSQLERIAKGEEMTDLDFDLLALEQDREIDTHLNPRQIFKTTRKRSLSSVIAQVEKPLTEENHFLGKYGNQGTIPLGKRYHLKLEEVCWEGITALLEPVQRTVEIPLRQGEIFSEIIKNREISQKRKIEIFKTWFSLSQVRKRIKSGTLEEYFTLNPSLKESWERNGLLEKTEEETWIPTNLGERIFATVEQP